MFLIIGTFLSSFCLEIRPKTIFAVLRQTMHLDVWIEESYLDSLDQEEWPDVCTYLNIDPNDMLSLCSAQWRGECCQFTAQSSRPVDSTSTVPAAAALPGDCLYTDHALALHCSACSAMAM